MLFARADVHVVLLIILVVVSNSRADDVGLNVVELISKYGYPLERHRDVKTEDGYLLELHRIPYGKKRSSNKTRPAVLLTHCLLCSSAEFIYLGPKKSLGYILADQGYDVWLGNNRGNTWSRRHIQQDPNDLNGPFWDYNFDHLGYYDYPAMIDYVLNKTNQEKLFLIGHSQGSVVPLIMLNIRPEYNKKIKLFSAMAPGFYMSEGSTIRLIGRYLWPVFGPIMKLMRIKEILPKTWRLDSVSNFFCKDNTLTQPLCVAFLSSIVGSNPPQFNKSIIPIVTSSTPAGTSAQLLDHLRQVVSKGVATQFDYGKEENMKRYNSETAPAYTLKRGVAPVALYYGEGDTFFAAKEVEKLARELPNLALLYKVPDPKWTHLDFLWAKDAPKLLYKKVLEIMQNYQ